MIFYPNIIPRVSHHYTAIIPSSSILTINKQIREI